MKAKRLGSSPDDHRRRARFWLGLASGSLRLSEEQISLGLCRLASGNLIEAAERLGRALSHIDSAPGATAHRDAWGRRYDKLDRLREKFSNRCIVR